MGACRDGGGSLPFFSSISLISGSMLLSARSHQRLDVAVFCDFRVIDVLTSFFQWKFRCTGCVCVKACSSSSALCYDFDVMLA